MALSVPAMAAAIKAAMDSIDPPTPGLTAQGIAASTAYRNKLSLAIATAVIEQIQATAEVIVSTPAGPGTGVVL